MGTKSFVKGLAAGAVIGAAVGVATGLLNAPKSGKELRKDFADYANKMRMDVEKMLKNAKKGYKRNLRYRSRRSDQIVRQSEVY